MKVGILGLGPMGWTHADAVRKFDFVTATVGCDVSEETRRRAEARGLHTVATLDDLLAERPFAIVVATPPAAHAEGIRRCLMAGVHVLAEKPLTAVAAEGRELVAMAAARGLFFQVGFEIPYNGSSVGTEEILRRGLLGKPRHMSLIQISGPLPKGMSREVNGGIFYEKLCHQINEYRRFFGEPQRVMAICGPQTIGHYGVPDNVLCCLRFPGGEQGTIAFLLTRAAQVGGTDDHADRGHFYEFILTCENGSVTYNYWTDTLEVVRFNHREDRQSELVESIKVAARYGKGGYNVADQDRDFIECARDRRPLRFPASDAQLSMEWVERAERSLALDGEWVWGDGR